MSTWGRLDYANNKPKFPVEREVRTTIRLVSNVAANIATSNTRLFFPSTANLSVGMFISGNNVPTTANGGFFKSNVSIVTVNPANVIISQALTANTSIGDIFTFDTPIRRANNTVNQYNANTFSVTVTRKANTAGFSNTVAHTGWVHTRKGSGFVKSVAVSNSVSTLTYANAYLSFSGGYSTAANGQLVVSGTSNVSVVLNSVGAGYRDIPTVSATGANNATLIFTVTPGGRMGRVQTETLVAMSNNISTVANPVGSFFPG